MTRPGAGRARWTLGPALARLLLVLAGLAVLPDAWARTGSETTESGRLHFLAWEGRVLGQTLSGTACWVSGPDGSLRLEVLPSGRGSAGPWPLAGQLGDGYTLVLGPSGTGTFNPWGREWRAIDASAAGWVRFLTGWLEGEDPAGLAAGLGLRLLPRAGAHEPLRPRFLAPGAGRSTLKVQLPALALDQEGVQEAEDPAPSADSFRRRLTARAAGRGGRQEVLTLARLSTARGAVWSLTSSRKPGRLDLLPQSVWSTGPVIPEVFLPLWPMQQLLEIRDEISGTPGGGRG